MFIAHTYLVMENRHQNEFLNNIRKLHSEKVKQKLTSDLTYHVSLTTYCVVKNVKQNNRTFGIILLFLGAHFS